MVFLDTLFLKTSGYRIPEPGFKNKNYKEFLRVK